MGNSLKNLIGKIHLWLGLTSGLLVLIIALTGCIYAFQEEIKNITQDYRFVHKQEKSFLPPSKIQAISDEELPGKHIHAIMYFDSTQAANAIYYSLEDHYYYFVYINQYTGEVLKVKDEYADFFRFILDGHFYLWLPPEIGQPIVASVTLVFFGMLVTGIVLWWPRNHHGIRKKFSIKWTARWRRKNYDLHSILGFYISWLALVLVFTGLIWGFQWFRNGVFSIMSGGDEFVEYYNPASDSLSSYNSDLPAIDLVWMKMVREYPDAEWIEVHPPENAQSSIAANANPDASTYWKTDYRYFDQYTLEELPVTHNWNRFHQSTNAELLMRMNYDIHVGSILGLPGKILAFLLSLTIASLPVTGFLFWFGRRKSGFNQDLV
ncbi:MAG: PepSY-associated TM helix domain-containing protein [Cyclobacteriaceae bacterium]|nr:PepSY-associated TM helix domain-containing protein [Cyclobacteriaceae bacterium]